MNSATCNHWWMVVWLGGARLASPMPLFLAETVWCPCMYRWKTLFGQAQEATTAVSIIVTHPASYLTFLALLFRSSFRGLFFFLGWFSVGETIRSHQLVDDICRSNNYGHDSRGDCWHWYVSRGETRCTKYFLHVFNCFQEGKLILQSGQKKSVKI